MKDQYSLQALQQDWLNFLWNRGHAVKIRRQKDGIVVTHSRDGSTFRWILFTADGPIKKLRLEEKRRLKRQIRLARSERQKVFVVVHFSYPAPKVVIKPADKVLQTRQIDSARGGIDWYT